MYNYNRTQDSPFDPTKLAIQTFLRLEPDLISNCRHICKKTVSLHDIVHFIDEEIIVTNKDFNCVFSFYPEVPTNAGKINHERKKILKPSINPNASQVTINIKVLFIRSIPVISFRTRTIQGTRVQQVLGLSSTIMKGTLCPISILKKQPPT